RFFQPDIEPDPAFYDAGIGSGFNLGWHDLNRDCRYAASLPATPAAAAVVAGSVALLLEAKPELSWRDLKHLLAKTARLIDVDRPAELTNIEGSVYVRILPWTINAAGYSFHNAYGFGALD